MKNSTIFFRTILLIAFLPSLVSAQDKTLKSKFRQLKEEFATPNEYHTASGAPGHMYWQQKVDYKINIVLDYYINHTMMRIDLPENLYPTGSYSFKIKWWYNINDRLKDGGGRSGMEFFPEDGNYIYTIAHFFPRMAVYNEVEGWQMTFDYPYPVAISVHTNQIGMEYTMICFNGGRPNKDGSYSDETKYSMIMVVLHEVGHNYFPMIVNSDERQWTWMDEGLNTFIQGVSQPEWEENYPGWSGQPASIVNYMKADRDSYVPIMTNSESVKNLGANAYNKTAVGLHILRETIMGRELFDHAFKEYSRRWMFKHPSSEDFFRTMEDASAVDLDWFWRGWFYTTDNVDIAIDEVKHMVKKGMEDNKSLKSNNFYQIGFKNIGGMLMPLILKFEYEDGSSEVIKVPVEIWRKNNNVVTKIFANKKRAKKVILDPYLETADTNIENNVLGD